MLQHNSALKSLIDKLWQNFWEGGIANPPFTGNIDKGDINETLQLLTTKTELLFVERIYHMLKPGGTAAVIVQSGVIQNSGRAFEALRRLLLEKNRTESRDCLARRGI